MPFGPVDLPGTGMPLAAFLIPRTERFAPTPPETFWFAPYVCWPELAELVDTLISNHRAADFFLPLVDSESHSLRGKPCGLRIEALLWLLELLFDAIIYV